MKTSDAKASKFV